MNLLLDTQAILLAGQDALPKAAREAILDPTNTVHYSLVSFWEIGLKAAIGKLKLGMPLGGLLDAVELHLGAQEIPLDIKAVEKATKLPSHHKDPFDRMLAGQALTAGLSIVSGDKAFDAYGCKRIWSAKA